MDEFREVTKMIMSEIDKDINVPNKNDSISRRAAIRLASGGCHPANVAKELAKLPPSQPEIIRCKECIHWKHSAARKSYCEVFDWMSKAEDFCSFAERRTDECD